MLRLLFPVFFKAMERNEKMTYSEFRDGLHKVAEDCEIGKVVKPVLAANLFALIVAAALFLGKVSADFFRMGTTNSYTSYFQQTRLALANDVTGPLALAFLLLGICIYLWDYFKQKSLSLMAFRKDLSRDVCEEYRIELGQSKTRTVSEIMQFVVAGLTIAALLILCLQQRSIKVSICSLIPAAICVMHIWSLIPSGDSDELQSDRHKAIFYVLVSAVSFLAIFYVLEWLAPSVFDNCIVPLVSSVALVLIFTEIYWFLLIGVHFGYVFCVSKCKREVAEKATIDEGESQNSKRQRTFKGWLRRTVAVGSVTVLISIPLLILLTIATLNLLCIFIALFYWIFSSLLIYFPIV